MKQILFTFAILMLALISFGQSSTYVRGYTRSNGTYVQGYYRTTPNHTRNDNYSTTGNYNPYTGAYGTKPGDCYSTRSNTSTSTYSSNYKPTTYSSSSYNTPSYTTYYTRVPVSRHRYRTTTYRHY